VTRIWITGAHLHQNLAGDLERKKKSSSELPTFTQQVISGITQLCRFGVRYLECKPGRKFARIVHEAFTVDKMVPQLVFFLSTSMFRYLALFHHSKIFTHHRPQKCSTDPVWLSWITTDCCRDNDLDLYWGLARRMPWW